jgi:hypothetical protein
MFRLFAIFRELITKQPKSHTNKLGLSNAMFVNVQIVYGEQPKYVEARQS